MRWILRIAGFFVVLAIVAVLSLLFLPKERIAAIATDQLTGLTGREVRIDGDVGLTFWPVLGVRVEGLTVGGPDWSDAGPMLEAARAALGVEASALLRGEIQVTHLEATQPVVRLEQRADGRASWIFDSGQETASASEPTRADASEENASGAAGQASVSGGVHVAKVRITQASLIYEAEGSAPLRLEDIDLALDWEDATGPAAIRVDAQPAGALVSLAAEIADLGGLLQGEVQALNAALDTPSGALRFAGRASTEGALAGQVTLRTEPTDGFLAALGLPPAGLPPKLGQQLELTADVTLTPDSRLSLRDLVADLGGNTLRGAADVNYASVPQINAQIVAGALDLSSLTDTAPPGGGAAAGTGAPSTAAATAPASSGWPRDTIDASALAAFTGEVALSADSIAVGGFDLGRTRAILRNDAARMVFELREVAAYGGSVTGDFVVNGRGGLSVGGRLNASNLQMQPVLRDAIGLERLTGNAAAQLSFLGVGASVDAIMNSLSGDGRIDIGQGTIEGINLDRLMRGGDVGSGTTIFDSLAGSWTIDKGVLSNQDLLLQLKNYEARGAGLVGLGAQTIDYTFTPVALRANSGQGLAIPVRFQGPWSDVAIRPDVEAALDLQVDAEIDKLEAEAKEKVDQKLDDLRDEGKALEDTVKDDLKDQLLRKLFD